MDNIFQVKGPHGLYIFKKEILTGVRIVSDADGKKRVRLLLTSGAEDIYEEYLEKVIDILKGN